MPKVPTTDRPQRTPQAPHADPIAELPVTAFDAADRPAGSTVSQICVKDISRLKARSAELLDMLLSERP